MYDSPQLYLEKEGDGAGYAGYSREKNLLNGWEMEEDGGTHTMGGLSE